METTEFGLIALLILLIVGTVLICGNFIWQNHKDQKRLMKGSEQFYNFLYASIQRQIHDLPVTEENYHSIMNQLEELGQLQYKNKEKTCTLTDNFFMSKFRPFREREIFEAELSKVEW